MDTSRAGQGRVLELAEEALGRPASERPSFLRSRCGDDDRLLARCLELIEEASGFDDLPTLRLEAGRIATADGARPGHLQGDGVPRDLAGYRLLRILGEGGMGIVYLAEQERPRRRVALKVLHPFLLHSARSRRRFEIEVDVLARLEHPGIASIYDAGTAVAGGEEVPYLTMEWVEGEPLGDYVRRARPAREARIELVAAIADAVQHAHRKGVVHRDLKPGNVLINADGKPKVVDFGIAASTDERLGATRLTAAGTVPGTRDFLAPEQVRGAAQDVDLRTDVYALGLLAHEVLGGEPAFRLERLPLSEAVERILHAEPTPLGRLDPGCAGDLQTVLQKAHHKDPERRYESAAAFADDLRRALRSEPVTARSPDAAYHLRLLLRRHPRESALAGMLLAVLVAAAAVLFVQNRSLTRANQMLTLAARYFVDAEEGGEPASGPERVTLDPLGASRSLEEARLAAPPLSIFYSVTARHERWSEDLERSVAAFERAHLAGGGDRVFDAAGEPVALPTLLFELPLAEGGRLEGLSGIRRTEHGVVRITGELEHPVGGPGLPVALFERAQLLWRAYAWSRRSAFADEELRERYEARCRAALLRTERTGDACYGPLAEATRLVLLDREREGSPLAGRDALERAARTLEARRRSEYWHLKGTLALRQYVLSFAPALPYSAEEAEAAFTEAVWLDPDDFMSWGHLGLARRDLAGKEAPAFEAYTRAAELCPDNPPLWANVALAARDFDRHDACVAAALRVLAHEGSTASDLDRVVQTLLTIDRFEPARAGLRLLRERGLAGASTRRQELELVLRPDAETLEDGAVDALLADPPDDPRWWLEAARLARRSGRAAHAAQLEARIRSEAPDGLAAALLRAGELERAGDLDGARRAVEAAMIAQEDGRERLVEELVRLASAAGKPPPRAADLPAPVSFERQQYWSAILFARRLDALGARALACELLATWVATPPGEPRPANELVCQLVELLLSADEPEALDRAWEHLVPVDDEDRQRPVSIAWFHRLRAIFAARAERWEEVLDHAQRFGAIRGAPLADVALAEARAQLGLGRREEAGESLWTARRLRGEPFRGRLLAGWEAALAADLGPPR
ncbi:MAG: serine/threonine-protein kinase [Planctomycetota bacterium]